MKKIYIAGKYRDQRGEWYVRMNIREAESAAVQIWKFGGAAFCPHKNTAGLGGVLNIPDEVWLQGDLEFLAVCDALYALPNYVTSNGARAEIAFALEHGIKVFYSLNDVRGFVNSP